MSTETANKCGKCGFCLAVCPVYSAMGEEQVSPRAKIQLIRAFNEGNLESSELLKELMSKCLMCGSCTANCPSAVDHYPQFMRMRSQMIKDHGEKVEIRSLVYMLAKERRLKFVASLAKVGQSLTPKGVADKCKLANIPISKFPTLNNKSFRSQVGTTVEPVGEYKGTVLYFTGCATNYIFADTGFATVKILNNMGYRVVIPASQVCCSVPMLLHGAVEQARENIQTNVDCFSVDGIEAVIVDCPTCGSTIKNEYPDVIGAFGGDVEKAKILSGKISDIMSFIYERWDMLELDTLKVESSETVTYHAPCHLKNIFNPSDRIFEKLEGVTYNSVPDSRECCGGGGTFFYEYPEVASVLVGRKVASAAKSGADLWLTDCPVCRINLDGNQTTEEHLELMHPVQFLESLLV